MAVVRTRAGVFRKDSYDANNDIAISKVIKYLESKGMRCEYKDEEDFDIDLICYKGKKKYRVEVEVKNTYFENEETYPFETVSFLKRKKKYANDGIFYYFLLSKQCESFLFCKSNIIYKDEYYEKCNVNTSQRYGNDEFYRVPKHLCEFRHF
jgi:hypothetical protein